MKNLIQIFLIFCFIFSNFACTTNTSDGGTLYYREKFGEWDWHEDGDEFKDSRKYEGDIRKGEPHGRGKLIHYKFPKESAFFFQLCRCIGYEPAFSFSINSDFWCIYMDDTESRCRYKTACHL